ncbi:transmembrane protein, putative (macronuclear) [Tetrahymena thermophila SB210]|uniref:Transmembrane protein, putative n=1 Tax=Tetrahymena thermophila (strain SB210) TaxID=312017 RepID=W7X5Z4_TETTS|nr:transmembrane protein, putative [Tetrahymena thermophila SB210]EWS72787.1 transmembrane protein, putative [Tetrahymena thermophila SB210]|eukprot:XP_012654674.1 transmembrane protein, putative [Tetrahymena thermophila SB210]
MDRVEGSNNQKNQLVTYLQLIVIIQLVILLCKSRLPFGLPTHIKYLCYYFFITIQDDNCYYYYLNKTYQFVWVRFVCFLFVFCFFFINDGKLKNIKGNLSKCQMFACLLVSQFVNQKRIKQVVYLINQFSFFFKGFQERYTNLVVVPLQKDQLRLLLPHRQGNRHSRLQRLTLRRIKSYLRKIVSFKSEVKALQESYTQERSSSKQFYSSFHRPSQRSKRSAFREKGFPQIRLKSFAQPKCFLFQG